MAGGSEDKWNGNSWSCRENRTQTGGIAISTGVMGPVWSTTCKANSSVLENKMLIFSSRKKLLECFEVFWCEEKKQLRIIIIIEGIQAKSEGEEANTLIDQGIITWCHFSWVTRQSTLSTRNIDTAIRGFFLVPSFIVPPHPYSKQRWKDGLHLTGGFSQPHQPGRWGQVPAACGTLQLGAGMEGRERTPDGAQHSLSKTFALKGAIHNFFRVALQAQ